MTVGEVTIPSTKGSPIMPEATHRKTDAQA